MKSLFLFFTAITSLGFAQQNTITQFVWLEGNWKQQGKESFEKWQTINDTMIGGVSYHYAQELHDKDETDIFYDESIRLVVRGTKCYYIPQVSGQNKGEEIPFEIISVSAKSFVAENQAHDFPQRIVYKLVGRKKLIAYIEGKTNGAYKRIEFHFTKQ